MDLIQPTPRINPGPDEQPGFRAWLPYQSTEPCCEPDAHIRAEHLSIAYQGQQALRNVNLEINRGCITALVGPSGCGKTSFLMSLNRLTDLIPECHVSGHLHMNELNVLAATTDLVLWTTSQTITPIAPGQGVPFPYSTKGPAQFFVVPLV